MATGPRNSAHRIEDVRYVGTPPGPEGHYPTAPASCVCGWHGELQDYAPHKPSKAVPPIPQPVGTSRHPVSDTTGTGFCDHCERRVKVYLGKLEHARGGANRVVKGFEISLGRRNGSIPF
jgi:hypothetical protein